MGLQNLYYGGGGEGKAAADGYSAREMASSQREAAPLGEGEGGGSSGEGG